MIRWLSTRSRLALATFYYVSGAVVAGVVYYAGAPEVTLPACALGCWLVYLAGRADARARKAVTPPPAPYTWTDPDREEGW